MAGQSAFFGDNSSAFIDGRHHLTVCADGDDDFAFYIDCQCFFCISDNYRFTESDSFADSLAFCKDVSDYVHFHQVGGTRLANRDASSDDNKVSVFHIAMLQAFIHRFFKQLICRFH